MPKMKRTQRVLLGIAIASTILFVLVAVGAKNGVLARFDIAGLELAHSASNHTFDAVVPVLTNLAEPVYVAIAAVLLGMVLALRRQWRAAAFMLAGVGGASVLNLLLKHIADRARPELWTHLVAETNQSFPSGHATASIALALCIAVILWHTKWRYAAIIGGALYVGLVAFTRLYAGVHYPSDILAAWLITGAWVALSVVIVAKIFSGKSHLNT